MSRDTWRAAVEQLVEDTNRSVFELGAVDVQRVLANAAMFHSCMVVLAAADNLNEDQRDMVVNALAKSHPVVRRLGMQCSGAALELRKP